DWDIFDETWLLMWAEAHNIDPDSLRAERDTGETPKEGFYLPEGLLSFGTMEFVDDANAIGIPGVSVAKNSDNKETLEVRGRDTLEKLRDLLSGRYRIVEKSRAADYLELPDLRETKVMLNEHREAARKEHRNE
ncbi:MAG TPA: hypothetical protein VFJ72_02490, partial [Rubrobacteraceae bacterium]|nr:hypothetical protein [Rubrobacteraceae bacterium]